MKIHLFPFFQGVAVSKISRSFLRKALEMTKSVVISNEKEDVIRIWGEIFTESFLLQHPPVVGGAEQT